LVSFFFQAEDGIRDFHVTGVQTCALPIYIGNNPTINYVSIPRLEVHILDFNQEIYDEVISVDFVKFLRDEEKFASVEAMIAQINQDIINTKAILEKNICE